MSNAEERLNTYFKFIPPQPPGVKCAGGETVTLDKLYGACGFWPTMLLHTTNVSLEARLSPTPTGGRAVTHEPTRAEADAALKCAHDLIALLLHRCNEFFGWGLDVGQLARDAVRCWGAGTGS